MYSKMMMHLLLAAPFLLIWGLHVVDSKSECTPWKPGGNTLDAETATCAKPVKALPSGQASGGTWGKHPSQLPPWYNETAFAIGQKWSNKHFFAQYWGPIHAFIIFTGYPEITRILMATRKSDTTPRSNRRYLATMLHMKLWFESGDEGSEEAAGPLFLASLLNVRGIHHQVLNKVGHKLPEKKAPTRLPKDEGFWAAVRADLEASDIPAWQRDYPKEVKLAKGAGSSGKVKPISHLSMALTQFMLAAPQVFRPEMSGIHGATEEEFEGFNHFWAVLVYALGVEDEYNIALQSGGVAATRRYYQQIYETYYVPCMFQIDHDGKVLWEAFFKAFVEAVFGSRGSQIVKKEQFMLVMLEELMGIEAKNLRARFTVADRALAVAVKQLVSRGMRFDTVREQVNALVKKYYFEANSKKVFGSDMKSAENIVDAAYA